MNKFKVGDRVRIRGRDDKGTVTKIIGEFCMIRFTSLFYEYHHELLIKLKKKQRLEGWVNVFKHGPERTLYRSEQEAKSNEVSGAVGYICTVKMREVKDE